MGARQKLNRLNGSLLVAGTVGAIAQSGLIFGLALAVLVAINLFTGEIRPAKWKR